MRATCSYLDNNQFGATIITIPQEAFERDAENRFRRLLKRNRFVQIEALQSRYRNSRTEYHFERQSVSDL